MGRPRLPVRELDENEKRLSRLPWKAISYLGLGQAARKEGVTEAQRHTFAVLQGEAFNGMNEGEIRELVKYLVWRQKRLQEALKTSQT